MERETLCGDFVKLRNYLQVVYIFSKYKFDRFTKFYFRNFPFTKDTASDYFNDQNETSDRNDNVSSEHNEHTSEVKEVVNVLNGEEKLKTEEIKPANEIKLETKCKKTYSKSFKCDQCDKK